MAEKAGERRGNSSPTGRSKDGSDTPSFADLSAFRKIIRKEREAAQLKEKPRPPSNDGY